MKQMAICDKCGSKITIIVRMSGNRFDYVYAMCETCGKDVDVKINYDNERTEEFD